MGKMRKEKFDEKLYVLNCQWLPREVAELLTKEETKCLVRNLQEHKNIASNLSKLTQSTFEENQKVIKRMEKDSNPRSNYDGMKAVNGKEGNKKLNMSSNYVKNAEEGSKKSSLKRDADGKDTEEDKEGNKELAMRNDGEGKNADKDQQETDVSIPRKHGNGMNADGDKKEKQEVNQGN